MLRKFLKLTKEFLVYESKQESESELESEPNPKSEHSHDLQVLLALEDVPVGERNHTAFCIMGCDCGTVFFFPEENFHLANEDYKQRVLRALEQKNMHPEYKEV